jgi:hypothetical protein
LEVQVVRKLIYDYNWQCLRIGLSFQDEKSCKDALERLKQYLCEDPGEGDSNRNRIYRVTNMLAATKMGLNGQLKKCDNTLRCFQIRKMIQHVDVFKCDVAEMPSIDNYIWPTDEKQLADLQKGWNDDPAAFRAIKLDLEKRMQKAKIDSSRPELENYLRMMEEVKRGFGARKQSR